MLIAVMMLALAAPGEQETVIATAPAGDQAPVVGAVAPEAAATPTTTVQDVAPHGLTTEQQIDRWVASGAPRPGPSDPGVYWRDDRKVHGEVTAGIGTNDYSSWGAAVSLPIGENGRLDLRYNQTKNGWGYPYGYGYGAGYEYGRLWDTGFAGEPYGAGTSRWTRTRVYEQDSGASADDR